MAAKYAWIFQILIFTHFGINWVRINTCTWDWVYNRPNWENIGPQSHLFKKSPILLWKTGPYTLTFASRHERTKRRTDLKFGIFPFDYKGNIWAKWEENLRGSCGRHLLISYGMTHITFCSKKCRWFWDSAQNITQVWIEVQFLKYIQSNI